MAGDEVGVIQEGDEKVCSPLQTSFLTLKEAEWMEIENQVPARIIPHMTVTPQQAENVPPRSREWTWPRCHLESVHGMMDQEPLTIEKWKSREGLQRRGGKDAENQGLHRECQNLEDPALWMENTTMDIVEKNPLEAAVLPEGEVAVAGEEELT